MSGYLSFNKQIVGELPASGDGTDAPLRHRWVFWEQAREEEPCASYNELTREIASISSVLDFWRVFSSIPQPSELLSPSDSTRPPSTVGSYMLFKEGVRPEWEDKANSDGGHFQFTLSLTTVRKGDLPPSVSSLALLDEFWNNLILAMIGGVLAEEGAVTGLRLVDKLRGNKNGNRSGGHLRVELWFRDFAGTKIDALKRSVEVALRTRLGGALGELHGVRIDVRAHGRGENTEMVFDGLNVPKGLNRRTALIS